jgi:hypothetical protein
MTESSESPAEQPKPAVRRPVGLIVLSLGLIVLAATYVISWGPGMITTIIELRHDKGAVGFLIGFETLLGIVLGWFCYCGIRGLGRVSEKNIRRVTGCCAVLVYFVISGRSPWLGKMDFVFPPFGWAWFVALSLLPIFCGALHWFMARSLMRRAGFEWSRKHSLSKSAVSLVAVGWWSNMSQVLDQSLGGMNTFPRDAIIHLLPLALAYVLYRLGVRLFAQKRNPASEQESEQRQEVKTEG